MTQGAPRAAVRETIHANAMLLGEAGLLLRGPSGSGKSALSLDLIDRAQARGDFARLVADDRVELTAANGRLIARPHPAIAGLMEIRGRGVVRVPFESAGVIRLVVDLLGAASWPERCPQQGAREAKLCGITLPRLYARADDPRAPSQIFHCLHTLVTK